MRWIDRVFYLMAGRHMRSPYVRFSAFSDRELRTLNESLVAGLKSPTASVSDYIAHEFMAEITVEANSRGRERCEAILR